MQLARCAPTGVTMIVCAALLMPAPAATAAAGDRQDKPQASRVHPKRFGVKPADIAYGAYQRGMYITALNLALPLAENGDAAAQTLAAEIYARGLGVRRNEKEAARWYAAAAEQSVPEALFQYALLLIDGRLVEKDEQTAFVMMKDSADAGNRLAQFNYAQLVTSRQPGPTGVAEAVTYYRRAADAGLADAQYAMSQILSTGAGGSPINEVEARGWLVRAARQNYDTAQLDLGTWLINGRGGKRDAKAGFGWLKLAAESGNVAAQNRVAKLYRAGIGVEPDSIQAAAWYILARRAGLVDPELNIFLGGLTNEERKTAIERANRLR